MTDTELLDWLDTLQRRKQRRGKRMDPLATDCHATYGFWCIFLRDNMGRIVAEGTANNIRDAIKKAMKEKQI